MTVRLFAALNVPDEVADLLVQMQKGLPAAKWRPRENLHITLRFFGEISENDARDLDAELALVECPPLSLKLQGIGSFGREEPRSVWAGVVPTPDLELLARRCDRAARRVGLTPEKHPFRPHVTLAYCKGTSPADVAAYAARYATFDTHEFHIDAFGLYSSWSGRKFSQYVEEVRYPLHAH